MSRRRRKRYGPVHQRGLPSRAIEQINESKQKQQAKSEPYYIPQGTAVHVRKPGEKHWRAHTTKADIVCHGFLWRNDYCYGFRQGDWEVKVSVDLFRTDGPVDW